MWAFSIVVFTSASPGQGGVAKLLASDGAAGDFFGHSVSISSTPGNEVAIVGAHLDDDRGVNSGAAYIYINSRSNWVERAKLLASDGVAGDLFGHSVAISGTPGHEVVIVGAYLADENGVNSGAAYIYRFNGLVWVEEQKLLPSNGAANEVFGFSVSISGTEGNEVAIVGAHLINDNGTDSGAAFIFRKNGASWIQEARLLSSDGEAGDIFGSAVSISNAPGNRVAIIGAAFDDDNGGASGSAYIYRFTGETWVEEQKLLALEGATSDLFGHSVSISGTPGNEVAIIGAYLNDENGANSGSAYVYRNRGAGWQEEAKLLASDGGEHDWFGWSVSISGTPDNEIAIIGAKQDDDIGENSGSAYICCFNGIAWEEAQKLVAADRAEGDQFGQSVSISGTSGNEVALVGANQNNDDGENSGSAYVYFDLPDCPTSTCPADSDNDGQVGIEDFLAVLSSWGPCAPPCPADTDADGSVGILDFLSVLSNWGPCP